MPGNGLSSSCLESQICATTTVYSQDTQSQTPPLVTVDSPYSVRSPPRSPRLNGLLHALKDVIGEDADYAYDFEDATYIEEPVKEASDYDNTTIEIGHPPTNVEEDCSESFEGNLTIDKDESLHLAFRSSQLSVQTSDYSIVTDVHPLPSALLSPIHLTTLPIYDAELNDDSDTDSGSLHTLKPNPRSSLGSLHSIFGALSSPTATPSHVLSSHFGGSISRPFPSPFVSAPVEHDDVISNISLDSPASPSFNDEPEPVPSEQYVIVGPEIGVVCDVVGEPEAISSTSEDESDDNDYADNSKAGHCSQEDTTSLCVGIPPATPEEVHDASQEASQTPVHFLADNVDFVESEAIVKSPSQLSNPDDMASSTSHTWEVHNAFRQATQTPVHFLAGNVDFDESEAIANSSLQFSDPDDRASSTSHSSESPNILAALAKRELERKSIIPVEDLEDGNIEVERKTQLAYLCSPFNDTDILHSLYDQYYDLPEEESEEKSPLLVTPVDDIHLDTAEVHSSSGLTPVRSGFLREPVFTPPSAIPATRGRSGTVIALDSSHSRSARTITCSLFERARSSSASTGSPEITVSEVHEVIVSKKVPFGFRKSTGRSGTTTFSSQRSSMTIRPPSQTPQPPENISSPNSAPINGLRPLRLSQSTNSASSQPSSAPTHKSVFSADIYRSSRNSHRVSLSSTSVSSNYSYSRNPLLLSSFNSSVIPEPHGVRNTPFTNEDIPSPLSSIHLRRLTTFESAFYGSPRSAPLSRPLSWQSISVADLSDLSEKAHHESMLTRSSRRLSEPPCIYEDAEDEQNGIVQDDERAHSICRTPITNHRASFIGRRTSIPRPPLHAISVPKPTLMFAIASDDVKQVQRVLENGDAGPNDSVGPQSALAFALTNEQLTNRMEIVKTLLAYGADPTAIVQPASRDVSDSPSPDQGQSSKDSEMPPHPPFMDRLDPATRYYVQRANEPHTRKASVLVQRSDFRPLTRVRYELVGQDRALEQLFKDLSIHSRQLSVTPIVILLCGPSGHGKSFLARKFGSLLDYPTHTVGMTTIHSAQDLWKSYSISPNDPPSTRTLAEFLCDNEGKRCVVVLDEIEKTHGESPLWALLMPWEHGRCTFEANGRLVDTRNVIWLGTSNIGQDLVFEHHDARALPHEQMSKGEYTELMAILRPRVSERLGASMLSRVTSVLPFVPFTLEEREAICYEALYTIAGDIIQTLSTDVVDAMVKGALANYTVAEGARSIYRAVSNQLVETI
ncbi:hypothetical protein C0993_005900 [Termitomyces sp. T159_Od127]|nr:hypothetical protein C0993_005900 [Termitomyces sp. T159_Od127]